MTRRRDWHTIRGNAYQNQFGHRSFRIEDLAMEMKEPSAVGVFDNLENAERSIDQLRAAGFSPEEIGIIGHVNEGESVPTPPAMNPPEDSAIMGVIRGGIWGAIVGGLVVLVIPGLGQVTELGRWFEVVGGLVLGAAVGGTLLAFGGLLFYLPKTRYFAHELDKGRFIVTVKNAGRQAEAMKVLRREGGTTR